MLTHTSQKLILKYDIKIDTNSDELIQMEVNNIIKERHLIKKRKYMKVIFKD